MSGGKIVKKNVFDVKRRVVVITGGMGQLGRQFALSLLEQKARVAVFDVVISDDRIKTRFGESSGNPDLMFCETDITDRKSIEKALKAVENRWETPFGLVNNAAIDSPPHAPAEENGMFETYPEDSLDRILNVNVKGQVLCCQVIGGAMAKTGRGSIINVNSIYGMVSPDQRIYEYRRKDGKPFFKPVAYSVSKSALFNLTRYLATYWGSKNVRVNTVTFAGVFNNQDAQFLDGYLPKVPLGRMAKEDEYNGAIVFLLSDASSYMTGANLVLDGGFTAW